MSRTDWPVILDAGFREKIENGWSVSVHCLRSERNRSGQWIGCWHLSCISPDRKETKILIIRRNAEPREIMSANGVIAFLSELGFMTPSVPLVVGSNVELGPEQRTAPSTSED